jgi:hypothetical protein
MSYDDITPEQIERVARAIQEQRFGPPFDVLSEDERRTALVEAREAIVNLRQSEAHLGRRQNRPFWEGDMNLSEAE